MLNSASTPASCPFTLSLFFMLTTACHLETPAHRSSDGSRLPLGGSDHIPPNVRMSLPGDGTLCFILEPTPTEPNPGIQIASADGIPAIFQPQLRRYDVPLARLSRQAVLGGWTVQVNGQRSHNLQLRQEVAARLIEALGQDQTTRVAIEDRISTVRPELPSAKLFDCRTDLSLGPSPDETSQIAQMRVSAEERRAAKITAFEDSSRAHSAQKSFLEAEVARLEQAIGGSILQGMGQVTGRGTDGYFVFGAVIPLGDVENIALHEHTVFQAPFFVSGNSLQIIANTVLAPTHVVYRRLTPATNAFGAKMLIPAYTSNLTPRQRSLATQLEASRRQLSEMNRQQPPSQPDLSSEDLEIALADALVWRHRWCTSHATTSAHGPLAFHPQDFTPF